MITDKELEYFDSFHTKEFNAEDFLAFQKILKKEKLEVSFGKKPKPVIETLFKHYGDIRKKKRVSVLHATTAVQLRKAVADRNNIEFALQKAHDTIKFEIINERAFNAADPEQKYIVLDTTSGNFFIVRSNAYEELCQELIADITKGFYEKFTKHIVVDPSAITFSKSEKRWGLIDILVKLPLDTFPENEVSRRFKASKRMGNELAKLAVRISKLSSMLPTAGLSSNQRVLGRFESTGIIVRMLGMFNTFGDGLLSRGELDLNKILAYEFDNRPGSEQHVETRSASYIRQGLRLDTAGPADYGIIYDPHMLAVVHAFRSDAHSRRGGRVETSQTDYAAPNYRNNEVFFTPRTIEGLAFKVSRRGNPLQHARYWRSFSHNEVLVRPRLNNSFKEAIIGIVIKNTISAQNLEKVKNAVDALKPNLAIFAYDNEGVLKLIQTKMQTPTPVAVSSSEDASTLLKQRDELRERRVRVADEYYKALRQHPVSNFAAEENKKKNPPLGTGELYKILYLREPSTGDRYGMYIKCNNESEVSYGDLIAQIAHQLSITSNDILGLTSRGSRLSETEDVLLSTPLTFKLQLEPGTLPPSPASKHYAQMKLLNRALAQIETRLYQLSDTRARSGLLLVRPKLEFSPKPFIRPDLIATVIDRFKTIGLLARILGTDFGMTRISKASSRSFREYLEWECNNSTPVSTTLIQHGLHIQLYNFSKSPRIALLIDPLKIQVLGAFKHDAMTVHELDPLNVLGSDGKHRYNGTTNYARIGHLQEKYGAALPDGTISGLLSKLSKLDYGKLQPHNEVVVSPRAPHTTMRDSIIGIAVINIEGEALEKWLDKKSIRQVITDLAKGLPIFAYNPVESEVAFINAGGSSTHTN